MKKQFNKNQIVAVGVITIVLIFIFSVINNSNSKSPSDQQTAVKIDSSTAAPTTLTTSEKQTNSASSSPKPTIKPTKKPKKKKTTRKQKIKNKKNKIKEVIEDRVFQEYDQTRVDHISINEDLGTKKDGDYVALVYLIWNVKNSASLSRQVISMYSEDLAALVGKKCSNVQEIAIFWTIPYLDDATAKCSYERKGKGMYEMDTVFGF